jgi:hypothetical protein
MAKLTNEYIQGRIAGNAAVKDAYLDEDGNAVIVAADGFGWDCGDMPPATADIIDASKGAKHFNLSLDLIKQVAVIDAAPVTETIEEPAEEAPEAIEEAEETEEVAEDDNNANN